MARQWIEAPLIERIDWAEGLATFKLDCDLGPFKAGQFVDLGLMAEEERVSRAYSLSSAPGEPPEVYLALVPEGELTPRLFQLSLGDPVLVRFPAAGAFTLDRIPDARDLWLVSTGTGLGPYISMLRTEEPWERFQRIIVVHGVRHAADLGYRDELLAMSKAHDNRLAWVPVVSRQPDAADVVLGRITTALTTGELEARAGAPVGVEHSHVMLCGNPAMLEEMRAMLEARGMRRHSRRNPGQFTLEAYW